MRKLIVFSFCFYLLFIILLSKWNYSEEPFSKMPTGESVIGANVVIKGTFIGTQTDLDGKFTISVEPGTYDVQVSFITYQSITIEAVEVKARRSYCTWII